MYLLKKIIQFREDSHPDHEKPFLEHLEDLRIMITRIVITLLVSMIVCFAFQKQLMDVLRLPVERMWVQQLEEQLPQEKQGAAKTVDAGLWEKAKQVEQAASGLDGGQRDGFYALIDPDLAFHARSVALMRAVMALPEDSRAAFLESLDLSAPMKAQVEALVQKAPNPDMESRGNLRLMSALRPTETFMLSMKLSFFAGIVVSFPLLLMYVLQFILPGLHGHERRMMWPALLIGFGLFLCGVFFAYFVVLPRALDFFHEWSGKLGVSNDWRIGEYISFATRFTLLFGLSFELPVVVMVLVKLGMLSYETMSGSRSYAVLAIFVTAAILTPTPDAFTLILMALPMLVLYEICIWLAWFDARRNRMEAEKEAREREENLLARNAYGQEGDVPAGQDGHNEGDLSVDEAGDDGYSVDYENHDFQEFEDYPPTDDADGQAGPEPDDGPGEKPGSSAP